MRDRLNLTALWVLGFAIAALFSCVNEAQAGTVTLSWTGPTTCADGISQLTDCPTTGFEISEGTTQTGTYTVKETVAPTVLSRTYSYSPGTRCFLAKTWSNTLKSDESTRVCTTVPSLPPKAPQGMTVTVAITVSASPP